MFNNVGGAHNTAVGYLALHTSTSGNNHTAFGQEALHKVTTGSNNQGIGRDAGSEITTGDNNVCLGTAAGDGITTGDSNVCVGYNAGAVTTGDNQLYIARGNGNQGTDAVWLYGTATGTIVNGDNGTAFTQTSDRRIKKNITDYDKGLEEIDKIKLRNFEYRSFEELDDDVKALNDGKGLNVIGKPGTHAGVIAQEIEEIFPNDVQDMDDGTKVVTADEMHWALIKAVQELSAEVEALKAKLKD